MFQFNVRGAVPRQSHRDVVYCVRSRDSLYAVHRVDVGSGTTKACFVAFRERSAAARMSRALQRLQRAGKVVDGEMHRSTMILRDVSYGRPTMPLKVEPRTLRTLQYACLLQFHDLLLVTSIQEEEAAAAATFRLDCLEFVSPEPPNRAQLNLWFESMMH